MAETQSGSDAPSLSDLIDEEARRRFEAAWAQGRPEPIERFLPAEGTPAFVPTLEELVCVELEFAWKTARGKAGAGAGPLVEAYLKRFPALNEPARVLRLLREEYRVRRRRGDGPDVEEYRRRFPEVVRTGREVEGTASDSDVTLRHEPTVPVKETYDFLAPPVGPDEIGRLGPYRVLRVLGKGGMGVVFQAEDPERGARVALKTMRPSVAAGAPERRRFLREARAAAELTHDNIVRIIHTGEDRGCPFFAMPLLEGATLEEHLRAKQSWSVRELLHVGREIARGLAAAHQCGMVHRDIKPSNIWVEPLPGVQPPAVPYRLKILDFGLVKILEPELGAGGEMSYLTGVGTVVGTPAYMSPEQARCAPIDYRCDLFSLGCILYRLSTTRSAFTGDDAVSVLSAVISHTPQPPATLRPDLPGAFADLMVQLLAKDPAGRPQSATAVVEAIDAIEQGLQEKAVPPAAGTAGLQPGEPTLPGDTALGSGSGARGEDQGPGVLRRAVGVLRRRFGLERGEGPTSPPAAAEPSPPGTAADPGAQDGA